MWGNYEKLTYGILNRGAVIGVTGGGDNHEARGEFSCEYPEGQGITPHTFSPGMKWKTGLTAALMPRLGRKELVRALRERRTYATTGPRILVDFSVSGVPMGGECNVGRDATTVVGAVHGVSKVARVEIIRDGRTVQSIGGDNQDMIVIDPLICSRCGSPMRILAVITEPEEVKRIIRHLVKVGRPPPGLNPSFV